MPLYAYRCEDCQTTFQTLVRSGETPECPHCASVKLGRQLSLIAQPARGGDDYSPTPAVPCDTGDCGMCPAMAGACG